MIGEIKIESVEVFTLAESLGGYESLAELPSVMTHASVPEEDRAKLGITDNLIRYDCSLIFRATFVFFEEML